MAHTIWTLDRGSGPIVATAVHDGHAVRAEVAREMALDEATRLREEDPFTGRWTTIAPTRVIATRSRFEVDLNRPRETAVYRTPEEAWGLEVWDDVLPEDIVERSLEGYDAFYDKLRSLYGDLERRYGNFLVLDLHSYNHRREGPEGPVADPTENPQVNIGTGTMKDRSRWARVIDRFIDELTSFDFPGGRLDVRENVKFRGGACAAWTHRTFPRSSCVLSIEVKKFFMDEWTGEADEVLLGAVGEALASTLPGALEELGR
ncbi:MAG: N-formylglutamate amidohydrolase [Acidobacteriota bacterium]|jgi:N-formylglutamate deformylase